MKTALYPGTFDPPTLGHLDIIERAAKMVGTLYVGVATNTGKGPALFTVEERIELLREVTKQLSNVEIVVVDGLVADFVKDHSICCIVRGLRAASDCDNEFRMAIANRQMGGAETLFLVASDHLAHLSATLIREIAASGKHLENFVPAGIVERVYQQKNGPHGQ